MRAASRLSLAGILFAALPHSAGMAVGQTVAPSPLPGQTAAPAPSAPVAASPAPDTATLQERAAAFWAARVTGDVQAQWDLLEPRWRGRMTPLEYGADQAVGGRYLAYQVEGATVKGSFAEVKVKLLVQQVLPPSAASRAVGPQAVVLDDGWIRIRG